MKNLTLETSLKPFYGLDADQTRGLCEQALMQWRPLLREADQVSVLFWAADGSEILEYDGKPESEMEWARFIGNANAHLHPKIPADPEKRSLHARAYLYREEARPITYRRLGEIARCWRQAIGAMGKRPRIGLTFDPGGEFAPSSFKYERHREICMADTMGEASFVCCYASLKGDDRAYAGFPTGIPDGTSLGTFLGRQFARIARDLGFDYLWLSNGFGFGMETWKVQGPLFDGAKFTPGNALELRARILGFWTDFRAECPDLDLETRGTNLGTGTDLASDATPLREIYAGDFNVAPPPNSPWAAINGDFGIEMAGYLSRIVESPPGKSIPFRLYIHDPWWLNSPWLDRYEAQPHDIYLPLSVSRLDERGGIEVPETLNLLSIDNSYGAMPHEVPEGATPHLLRAWKERADTAGPLVWLYPFDELHDAMYGCPYQPERLFHTDWFVREAINHGLPVNTVVGTRAFSQGDGLCRAALEGRILLSPAPLRAETDQSLLDWAEAGGRAIVYGPLKKAPGLRARLGLVEAPPIRGGMTIESTLHAVDGPVREPEVACFDHRSVVSGGDLEEAPAVGASAAVVARQETETRALASSFTTAKGGCVWWLRGPLPLHIPLESGGHLPLPDEPGSSFDLGALCRSVLAQWGWTLAFDRKSRLQRTPILSLHRFENGWFFSGYTPDTTVGLRLKSPFGAPLFLGAETWLQGAHSCYHTSRGWRYECRVFVEQTGESRISHREEVPGQIGVRRRMWVQGLKSAKLRFYPPVDPHLVTLWLNPEWPYITGEKAETQVVRTPQGLLVETCGPPIDGTVLISW